MDAALSGGLVARLLLVAALADMDAAVVAREQEYAADTRERCWLWMWMLLSRARWWVASCVRAGFPFADRASGSRETLAAGVAASGRK